MQEMRQERPRCFLKKALYEIKASDLHLSVRIF